MSQILSLVQAVKSLVDGDEAISPVVTSTNVIDDVQPGTTLKVLIAPYDTSMERKSRVDLQANVTIKLAVVKTLEDDGELDDLEYCCSVLERLSVRLAFASYDNGVSMVGSSIDTLYDKDLIRERRQYLGIISASYIIHYSSEAIPDVSSSSTL